MVLKNLWIKTATQCSVFLDLQKAFDTVNHTILLKKLEHWNSWFTTRVVYKSYLSNRDQYTKIGNTKSKIESIKCGVPQGSVLGPLLFVIYINDLNNAVQFTKVTHFADDTNLTIHNYSLKKINKYVNFDLKCVTEWLRSNRISLNTKKTEILLFRPKNTMIKKKLNFRISGQKIVLSKHVKYLGILIDENLSWIEHLSLLNLKVSI